MPPCGVRLKALPSKKPLPILSGGPLPEPDEKVEHVQVYRNGGVGALGSLLALQVSLALVLFALELIRGGVEKHRARATRTS